MSVGQVSHLVVNWTRRGSSQCHSAHHKRTSKTILMRFNQSPMIKHWWEASWYERRTGDPPSRLIYKERLQPTHSAHHKRTRKSILMGFNQRPLLINLLMRIFLRWAKDPSSDVQHLWWKYFGRSQMNLTTFLANSNSFRNQTTPPGSWSSHFLFSQNPKSQIQAKAKPTGYRLNQKFLTKQKICIFWQRQCLRNATKPYVSRLSIRQFKSNINFKHSYKPTKSN